ncbi:MAG: iron uptake porin [Xenococcus sp. MO_188.B8]|nr:iron uptake porin [Xenococcus sp. MO_188.B8]
MSNLSRNIFASTLILSIPATILLAGVAGPTYAEKLPESSLKQIEEYSEPNSLGGLTEEFNQVTNVNQLRDVSPSDWAYEALRSLVDRYGCIVGYPDQTYRGGQALSRYEFAAGLNACLNQIERLIASSEAVLREDIETINRLLQEFEVELAALGGRVDNLESRVAFLEDNQFSTTTKLTGEVIFGLGGVAAGSKNDGEDKIDQVTVFGDRVRLELETSFSGEDLLFTRLATGNFPSFAEETGTFQGDLSFAQPEDNDISLEVLYYTFPVGDRTEVLVGTAGVESDEFANTVSVLDGDGGSGAITNFGTRSPIYPEGDAALAFVHSFNDLIELNAGYLAEPANDPTPGSGLFNGPYSALGQLVFTPTDNLTFALTYKHAYNQSDTETGSTLANIRSFTESDTFPDGIPTVSNSYGGAFSWRLAEKFVLGGWGSYSYVGTLESGEGLNRGSQDIWQWAVTFAFPDLVKEGNMAGIIVGMEPWVTSSTIDALGDDDTTSVHVEAFFEYQINDNIAITPGIVWVTSPDNNSDNDDLVIGAIRTTFTF